MSSVFSGLAGQPFILLFLVVALGYVLGRANVKGIGLGATASTLLVGLALSLIAVRSYGLNLSIPEFASTLFFNLFMFSVGMKVGPQFISGLRRDAGKFIVLGLLIPFGPQTELQNGDVLRVTGSRYRIKLLEKESGRVVHASLATDIVTLAVGLTLGSLLGAITIPIGNVKFALGSAVGLLLVGIALSTIRTRHPRFGGPYPEPARRLIEDLGLNVFVAILGINAGAGVLRAIAQGAITPVVVGCLLVGFLPPIIGWVVGQKLLKMNPALLLGAVAGGRCSSPGMRAASEVSKSGVPAISYPVTFALANIVLTPMCYAMALLS